MVPVFEDEGKGEGVTVAVAEAVALVVSLAEALVVEVLDCVPVADTLGVPDSVLVTEVDIDQPVGVGVAVKDIVVEGEREAVPV